MWPKIALEQQPTYIGETTMQTATVRKAFRPILGQISTIASSVLEEELQTFGTSERGVISSIMAEMEKIFAKQQKIRPPFEVLVFPSSHEERTKHDIERAEYELRSIAAFRKRKIRDYATRAILARTKRLRVKKVSFEIIEGKRILIKLTG